MAERALWRRCSAETLGTFALMFAGTGAVAANGLGGGAVTPIGVSAVFGLLVMAMVNARGCTGSIGNLAVTSWRFNTGYFRNRYR